MSGALGIGGGGTNGGGGVIPRGGAAILGDVGLVSVQAAALLGVERLWRERIFQMLVSGAVAWDLRLTLLEEGQAWSFEER